MAKLKSKIIYISLFFCCNLFSHGGRTDSDGGHYNRTTGEYHYHNKSSGFGKFVGGAVSIFILLAIFGKKERRK